MRYLVIFLAFTALQSLHAQTSEFNHVNLFLAYNTIDSLIASENIAEARMVYEDIKSQGYYIESWKQYDYGNKLYYERGDLRQSRKELLEAVNKGFFNIQIFYGIDSTFLIEMEEKYDNNISKRIIKINNRLTKRARKNHGPLIDELIELDAIDRELYRDPDYQRYRSYWFDLTYGDQLRDSTIHEEAMVGYREFRHRDSLKTERYANIIDSLGYVPDERITSGLTANVIIIHSSKYEKLSVDIDSIYLHSLKMGTLAPNIYGWYKGYYDERHFQDHTYYYTVGRDKIEALSEEEKITINQRRRTIGLRPFPATVWDYDIY
ncbi:MAG: hypothetical protein AAFY36_08670 [Bacteroidota bacterium]